MKFGRVVFLISLSLLVLLPACGGGSSTNFNNVVVTVAPTSTTVAAGGQVSLQATVTGVPGTAALLWSITELPGTGAQCNWLGSTAPAGPCPDGMLQGQDVSPYTHVTYLAPSGTGTFHVQVQWSTVFNPVVIKTATATIIVTP